jgi:hypothetical protein
MLDFLKAAWWLHAAFVVLAGIGFARFLFHTRFWLPRYVHWLAAIALGIGLGLLTIIPADAPVNRGDWAGVEKALIVLFFPAIVYVAFVFYGGQHAAYLARRSNEAVRCPHCHDGTGLPGEACDTCGQVIPLIS